MRILCILRRCSRTSIRAIRDTPTWTHPDPGLRIPGGYSIGTQKGNQMVFSKGEKVVIIKPEKIPILLFLQKKNGYFYYRWVFGNKKQKYLPYLAELSSGFIANWLRYQVFQKLKWYSRIIRLGYCNTVLQKLYYKKYKVFNIFKVFDHFRGIPAVTRIPSTRHGE